MATQLCRGADVRNILILEDNPLMQRAIARMVARWARPHLASDEGTARAVWKDIGVVGVIADLMLGKGTSLSLLRELRLSVDPRTPVMVLSGVDDEVLEAVPHACRPYRRRSPAWTPKTSLAVRSAQSGPGSSPATTWSTPR